MSRSFIDDIAEGIGYFCGNVFYSFKAAGRVIEARRPPPVQLVSLAVKQEAQQKDPGVEMAKLDPIGERLSKYEPAMTRLVPLEGGIGQLTLSIHKGERRVERRLELFDAKLIKKLGFASCRLPTLKIPVELDVSLTDYASAKSAKDTEVFLNEKLAGLDKPKAKTAKRKTVEAPVPEVAKESAPETTPEPAERPAPAAEKVVVKPASAKGERKKVTYIGRYVGSGVRTRPVKNPKPGEEKTFEQFCVDIEDAALNYGTNTIWGTDLERALGVAHVQKGDLIQITNHGRTPVDIKDGKKGEPAFKIVYEVKKL